MTDIRENLAQVICHNRAVDNWDVTQADLELADAILAALPGMVPELKWEKAPTLLGDEYCSGAYVAYQQVGGLWRCLVFTAGEMTELAAGAPFDTAKAAANAHHVAALMEAFGITQEGEQA